MASLAQEFARKLPIRVSRQIGNAFKEGVDDEFDTLEYRHWIRQGAARVRLAVSGDLYLALVSLGARGDLRTAAGQDDVRELLAFASSEQLAEARRVLGFDVRPRQEGDAPFVESSLELPPLEEVAQEPKPTPEPEPTETPEPRATATKEGGK